MDSESNTPSLVPLIPISATEFDFDDNNVGQSRRSAVLAVSPFDDANADIILRTSDSVDFRVIKIILALASPVFKCMFTLPQPSDNNEGSPPIIPISESSATVDVLLRFCYPVEAPHLNESEISLIGNVLAAAMKYDMASAIRPTKNALRVRAGMTNEDAIAAYAIACHLKLGHEARAAALACLKWPFPGPKVPQLALMSGLDHYNLLEFHRDAGQAVASLFVLGFPYDDFVTVTCTGITPVDHSCPSGYTELSFAQVVDGRLRDYCEYNWWTSAKSVFSAAFSVVPLDITRLTLSTIVKPLDDRGCSICRPKALNEWEKTREAIIVAINAKVDKVELAFSWN